MQIRIISEQDQSILIEWHDGERYHRSVVPKKEVNHGEVKAPELGIPYGEDWTKLIKAKVNPGLIDHELKKAGIWTIDDLRRNVAIAQGAINQAVSIILNDLLTNAEKTLDQRAEDTKLASSE